MGKASRKEARDRDPYRLNEPLTREELNEFYGHIPSMIVKTFFWVFFKLPWALLIATIVVSILWPILGGRQK